VTSLTTEVKTRVGHVKVDFIIILHLYREWQMERSFQTALTLFSPEVVFLLGKHSFLNKLKIYLQKKLRFPLARTPMKT